MPGTMTLPARAWRRVSGYGKGALLGLAVYLLLCALVFFCGFMIAFGNETPYSRPLLRAVEMFFVIAHPLWGIPLSMVLGAILLGRK